MSATASELQRKHTLLVLRLCAPGVLLGCQLATVKVGMVPAHCILVGADPGGEPLSHSQNLPIPAAGQRCIYLEDRLCPQRKGGNTARSDQFLHCTASWHLSD